MSRINLYLYIMPYEVETFVKMKGQDGEYIPKRALIDTGADKSLFPRQLLDSLEHTIIDSNITIDQAGIAKQAFQAVEAKFNIYFEDLQGNASNPIEVRAWFAETDEILIGIQDILEHATLFIDFRQSRTGWLEF